MTCLDQNADSLEALQSCVKRERGKIRAGVEFRMVCGKAEEFSFKAQKYDCVIASYVLGFVRDRDALMEKIRSALKPEGRLFIAASGDRKFHQLHELAERLDFERKREFADFVARRLEKNGPMNVDKDGRFYCCRI